MITQAPQVRHGHGSALSGTVLGGNSGASERASKEEQISSSGIEGRSCGTGEPAGTGSPAEDLQLNESHLAGTLDDIYVSDSASDVGL